MPPELIDLNWRPPRLTGARVTLRALEVGDADGLFAAASNPNVARYTLWDAHQSIDVTRTFLQTYAAERYREGQPDPLGIFLTRKSH